MNIKDYAESLTEYFSPKIIGEVNDVFVKVAKINGDKVPWHNHQHEDELFLIIKGKLIFEEEGRDSFEMSEGDLHIVKQGINHRVFSTEECSILLIENKSTAHTGDIESDITKSVDQQKLK